MVLTAFMRRLFSKVEVDIVCHVPRQYLQSKSATFCKPHEPSTSPQKQTSLPKFQCGVLEKRPHRLWGSLVYPQSACIAPSTSRS